ncbi:MAG TPA: 4-hydroxythreonine-4-phosphate dehydrogenase PdxA [Gammaproteobacteria bacterium]|nr:4-hydroxythreonine-4-phosphate dehydrogenase PdxA [Gammaproteobacteria bacterium]
MPSSLPRIALSSGEPAGIGPDICIVSAQQPHAADITVLGDPELLQARAAALGLPLSLHTGPHVSPEAQQAGHMHVFPVKLRVPCEAGRLDPDNAPYVIEMLERGADACLHHGFDALVTAPVHKGVINEAGIPFTGHTEFLAQRCQAGHVVMMLAAGTLRVALATTHLPLKDVPAALTRESLTDTLATLRAGLKSRFGVTEPHILVLGLNPHAGEGGHLGREELEIIGPACETMRARGMRVTGPVSADTAFNPARLGGIDVVLAMYHDQGLPVLKFAGFGHAVNITLGLPIIRTSVDHGTALELAGTGRAEHLSLEAALETAAAMVRHG